MFRVSKYLLIVLFLLLILSAISVIVLAQQTDTTAPKVVEFDFTPKLVDTSSSSQTITFTVRITDDLSGVYAATVQFVSPSHSQWRSVSFYEHHRVSGDSLDGVYVSEMVLPQYSEAGVWNLYDVNVYDQVNNINHLYKNDMDTLGFPTQPLVGAVISPSITSTLVYIDPHALTNTLEIQTDAVTETTLLAYTPKETVSGSPTGLGFAGKAFDLDAYQNYTLVSDFTFNEPITLTLYYSGFSSKEETLILAYWNGDSWVDITDSCPNSVYERDFEANWLKVPICHLTQFAMFGEVTPVYLPVILK